MTVLIVCMCICCFDSLPCTVAPLMGLDSYSQGLLQGALCLRLSAAGLANAVLGVPWRLAKIRDLIIHIPYGGVERCLLPL